MMFQNQIFAFFPFLWKNIPSKLTKIVTEGQNFRFRGFCIIENFICVKALRRTLEYSIRTFLNAYLISAQIYEHPFKELKFVCDICGKKFFENYFLQQHRKVHKAEAALPGMTEADLKSYTCDKCGKAFTTQFNLSYHYSQEHPKPEVLGMFSYLTSSLIKWKRDSSMGVSRKSMVDFEGLYYYGYTVHRPSNLHRFSGYA